jgi:hypothetical protein
MSVLEEAGKKNLLCQCQLRISMFFEEWACPAKRETTAAIC